MKLLLSFLFTITGTINAATTLGENHPFVIGTDVPDNNGIGLSDTRNVTSSITSITDLEITISLAGGWAGDMYAYLFHSSGFSVLLNRPGRTLSELAGSGVSEIDVTFSDSAMADIHTAIPNSGAVSGYFEPDARGMDPDNALNTSPRTAFLSSFAGQNANGNWTLYVADVATGDTMTLKSWTLGITGVPEPSCGLLAFAATVILLRRKRD